MQMHQLSDLVFEKCFQEICLERKKIKIKFQAFRGDISNFGSGCGVSSWIL